MTPFDLPLTQLGPIPAGNFETEAVAAVLTLMQEAHAGDYTPSVGDNPFDATIRAIDAKFGSTHPVAKKVNELFQGKRS